MDIRIQPAQPATSAASTRPAQTCEAPPRDTVTLSSGRTAPPGPRQMPAPPPPLEPALKKAVDALYEVGFKADDTWRHTIDKQKIVDYVAALDDPSLLSAMKKEFGERLGRETQSTYRLGATAGACCNQMRIYTAINIALSQRLQQISPEGR